MNQQFDSVNQLNEWLLENQVLSFTSSPKKLKRLEILLHALASRDFNPAHICPDFAEHSIFKGVVSHGIAVVSRAEGIFVEMMQFKEPVEIIATGFEFIKYHKPLRLGCWYRYEFNISNLRKVKNRWDFDCHILCKTLTPEKVIITEWKWKPSFIEHQGLSKEALTFLKPKSYLSNVLGQFIIEPTTRFIVITMGIFVLFSGVIILILQLLGFMKNSPIDLSAF